MAVNVKMGVDTGDFKKGIQEAKNEIKTLDQNLKLVDATFKATGNAEQALAQKTQTLNSKLTAQKSLVAQYEKALKQMTAEGVDPASNSYQKMAQAMLKAQTDVQNTQAALNGLGQSAEDAAAGADQLTQSVQGISKKVSLDQVISGINTITKGLETAARTAVRLGEELWNAVLDKARWADDTATMAAMYGIDVETFQQMQKLVTNGMDTSVDSMLRAQSKLKKGIGSDSKEIVEALQEIGVGVVEMSGKYGTEYTIDRTIDSLDLFFQVGQKIMALGDEYQREDMANKLFGRSWRELSDLFDKYHSVEEYNAALQETTTNSKETVENLVEFNDTVGKLKGNLDTLTTEILGQLAPGLTKIADSLSGVLEEIIAYLKTEDGQEMLRGLSDSVSSLFEDIGKIDSKQAVETFTNVFNGLVDGLKWIVDNKDTLVTALEVVVAGWAGLKLTGGALSLLKIIDGLKGLGLLGGAGAAGAGAAGGSVVGTAVTGITAGISSGITGLGGIGGLPGVILDMGLNQTNAGRAIRDGGDILEGLKQDVTEVSEGIKQNASTFGKDWSENVLVQPFIQAGEAIGKFLLGNGALYTPGSMEEADWRPSYMKDQQPVQIETEPVAPADAAGQISEQVGEVPIYFNLVPSDTNSFLYFMKMSGGGGYANGLPYVPNDGLRYLHRGEQVVPAREVQSRNFSSNLYVENMNMNGGLSADALAAAIANRNRRVMTGYGS